MATRYTIGKVQEDGQTIRSVYGHWDGYPEGAGNTLKFFYTDEDKIDSLLNFGDISVLDQQIGSPTEQNAFDNRTEGMCLFYGRDRGEDGIEALVHANVEEWLGFRRGACCEYGYLRVNGEWQTFQITPSGVTQLTEAN
jgi:hypothetical protein